MAEVNLALVATITEQGLSLCATSHLTGEVPCTTVTTNVLHQAIAELSAPCKSDYSAGFCMLLATAVQQLFNFCHPCAAPCLAAFKAVRCLG